MIEEKEREKEKRRKKKKKKENKGKIKTKYTICKIIWQRLLQRRRHCCYVLGIV